MSGKTLNSSYYRLVNCLLFVFPLFVTSVKVVSDLILFILVLSGLYIAISQRISPFRVPDIRLYSFITVFYFFMVCLSVILSTSALELLHFISRELHFLFAPLIGLAIFKAKINTNQLLIGIQIALIVLGVATLIEYLYLLSQDINSTGRPTGVFNASVFAQLTVTLLTVSFVGIYNKHKYLKLLSIISILMGTIALILSSSRGVWVAYIICVFSFILLFNKKNETDSNTKKANKLLVIMLTGIVITSLTNNDIIINRILAAFNEASLWYSGTNYIGSVSIRLETFIAGLKAIPDTPIFGYGYRNSTSIVANYANPEYQPDIAKRNHLHNAYLTTYIYTGIFGLLSFLLVLFAPMIMFIKRLKINSMDIEARMGFMLTLSFVLSGLTNIVFGEANLNGMYLLFLAYLLPSVIKKEKI